MRAVFKTCTYLVVDMLTHAVIVYFAGRLMGYDVSVGQAGIVGVAIEAVETIAYFIHEKIWEKIKLGTSG